MEKIVYYTDGSCNGNPGPGGFAYIRLGKQIHEDCGEYIAELILLENHVEFSTDTTNNREELKAIIAVLKNITTIKGKYEFIIYSDSAYAVNTCNTWIWNWQKNNWYRTKNSQVKNLDLILELYDLLQKTKVTIKKCDGHSGVLENELCDALASNNSIKFNRLIQQNKIKIDFNLKG